jgi:hypothetical protein
MNRRGVVLVDPSPDAGNEDRSGIEEPNTLRLGGCIIMLERKGRAKVPPKGGKMRSLLLLVVVSVDALEKEFDNGSGRMREVDDPPSP